MKEWRVKMPRHIFTFGTRQHFRNRYAVIQADSPEKARIKMFETFGNEWSVQYTEKEFAKAKSEGFFLNHTSLPTLYCE